DGAVQSRPSRISPLPYRDTWLLADAVRSSPDLSSLRAWMLLSTYTFLVDNDSVRLVCDKEWRVAIPDYQSVMLPLLRVLADGQEHLRDQYLQELAEHFGLTTEEQDARHPSGTLKFNDRVGWATTYLKHACLLERTGRKKIRITERGSTLLSTNPTHIDKSLLFQFPEFVQWYRSAGTGTAAPTTEQILDEGVPQSGTAEAPDSHHQTTAPTPIETATPMEALESSYQTLRRALAEDLLDRIKQAPPVFFEHLVVDLLVAMGYGGSRQDAGQAVGGSGDGGIDGIIKEDRLGLDFVYVQAKRWDNPVGRPTVQAFAGSLEGQRARKGVLITTSSFTGEAKEYVTRIEKRIVLVDGEQLAQHMIDFGVGVADVATYHVKRVDTDYFGDE
ncbi:MAG: restriction endonuclease, partial [Thermomicrobiales bacterium]